MNNISKLPKILKPTTFTCILTKFQKFQKFQKYLQMARKIDYYENNGPGRLGIRICNIPNEEVDFPLIMKYLLLDNRSCLILEDCRITDDQFIKIMYHLFTNKNNITQIWCHVGNSLTDKTINFLTNHTQYLLPYYLWIYGNKYYTTINQNIISEITFINYGPIIHGEIDGQYTNNELMACRLKHRLYMHNCDYNQEFKLNLSKDSKISEKLSKNGEKLSKESKNGEKLSKESENKNKMKEWSLEDDKFLTMFINKNIIKINAKFFFMFPIRRCFFGPDHLFDHKL